MAKIKPNIFYKWAETGGVTDPGVAKTQTGWVSEIPTYQNFNWVLNRADAFSQHVNERGIAEWDATTVYIENSIVTGSDGQTYKSIQDPNTGNDPVGDFGTNWIIDAQAEFFFDNGDVPVYNTTSRIYLPGSDLTSIYTPGTRVEISSPTIGVVYGEIRFSIWIPTNTQVTIALDDGVTFVNEAFDYIKISNQKTEKHNLPFGLSGLGNTKSINATSEALVRRVRTGVTFDTHKLVLTRPDVEVKRTSTTSAGDTVNETDFIKISASAGTIANKIKITNQHPTNTINIRYSLNKAAWVTNALAPAGNFELDLGANGILEMTTSNLEVNDPKMFNYFGETDASDNLFSWWSIAKWHYIT